MRSCRPGSLGSVRGRLIHAQRSAAHTMPPTAMDVNTIATQSCLQAAGKNVLSA